MARLRALAPTLIVLEATGGYATAGVAAVAAAALPVVVANPRQVRDFAKATGQLAKTDRLDAPLLALFAERVHPTPRPLPDAALQQLHALMTRRRQLLDMLTAERHRLEHAAAPIRREIPRHLRWHFTGAFVGMCCQDLAVTAMLADFDSFEYRDRPAHPAPFGPGD